ncbi:MAG: 50S ribosomal protein L15 [Caldisericaceae bacterium]
MRLNDLKPKSNATDKKIRVGRGNGSGRGTFSTYGCKGAKVRSGGTKQKGFEGGQTPLYRRLPKFRGFKPISRTEYIEINTDELEALASGAEELNLNEIFGNSVKVLGRGDVKSALKVKASKFSKSAVKKIEDAKGSVEVL